MGGSSLLMSAEEMVAYLKKTKLPTLIVEGTGDKALLRRVETELKELQVDILPIGGKDSLDAVYAQRAEYTEATIGFLRDLDCWVVNGVPVGYEDVIFTSGYSIENDVIHSGVVATLAGTMLNSLHIRVDLVANWFKHVVYAAHLGDDVDIARDVSSILQGDDYHPTALADLHKNPGGDDFFRRFEGDAWVWLRGKTLLRLIQDHLSKASPSYSKDQIVDLCIKMGPSPSFLNLVGRIKLRFTK